MTETVKNGQIISQFKIIDILPQGSGGMATVVRAARKDGTEVALKISRSVNDPFFSNAIKVEAEILQKLDHPGVVKILPIPSDLGKNLYMERATEISGHPWYFAMEFLRGSSLRDHLKKISTFSPGEAAYIGREVGLALSYIHGKGYAHNDIKTDNVIFRRLLESNATYEPVLIDFGIAAKIKRIQQDAGSILWMSPERLEETRGAVAPELIDATKVDIYALGVLLYRMLTAKMPFSGINEKSITTAIRSKIPDHVSIFNANVPKGLDEIIISCMEKRPEARPSLSQINNELSRYSTNRVSALPKTSGWFRRKK